VAGVATIHDSGPATGRLTLLRRRFRRADLVIFGHSHIPLDHTEHGQRILNPGSPTDHTEHGQRILNPGSPTDRRRQPQGTLGLL
jgi:predicted phosphodiesterase